MKEEIWRKVKGFEDYYEVSNTGKVRSISREIKRGNKGNYFQEGKELTISQNNKGYCIAKLWVNGKGKKYFVHRLVAEAFIDNPNKYPVINHKDENPLNNNVENLEWCSYSYNNSYGTKPERVRKALNKPIYQLDKQTKEIIKEWNCANEVAKNFNCSRGRISGWCQDYAEAEGYIWCYVEDYEKGYNGNVIKSINLNRCVYKINPVDLSVIAEYPNVSSTAKDGYDCGSVSNCCRGKAKKHKGYYWRYAD